MRTTTGQHNEALFRALNVLQATKGAGECAGHGNFCFIGPASQNSVMASRWRSDLMKRQSRLRASTAPRLGITLARCVEYTQYRVSGHTSDVILVRIVYLMVSMILLSRLPGPSVDCRVADSCMLSHRHSRSNLARYGIHQAHNRIGRKETSRDGVLRR
jgi:hypothetical protein